MKGFPARAVLFAAMIVPAVAGEPGESAVAFLEELKTDEQGPAELLEETALSPHCGELRRREISQRLSRQGRHFRINRYGFRVLAEKRDGDFAAVLVSAVSSHDPLEVDVLAVGLRKEGEDWKAAPVLGSFDNVDLAFDEELERRVESLELWMGGERLRQLRALHATVENDFRERMARALPPELLDKANPVQAVQAFARACLDGNLAAAMVLLGHLDELPTEEDRKLQQVMSRGMKGLDRRNHWRLLTSPDVVRVVVQEDPGDDLDAEVVMLIFDPNAGDQTDLLRFVLQRSEKRWKIELPISLRMADEDQLRFQRAVWRERDSDDARLRKRFEQYFEQKHEPRRGESLAEAGKQIEQTLREGTLEEFLTYLHRSDDLGDAERRAAYRYLGEFWSKLHEDKNAAADGELVEIIGKEEAGVLVFHLISTQLERPELVPLLLLRGEDGWSVAPGVSTGGNFEKVPDRLRVSQDEAIAAFHERKDELARKVAQRFLERFVAARPAEGAVVGEEEAGTLVKTFRAHLRDGQLLEALECCALLDSEEGAWEGLKSLSYEYRGLRIAKEPDRRLAVKGDQAWAAVSLRVDTGPSSIPDYPMYLVVATAQGPRIVVDVGLRHATNKGRELLNKRVWKRIEAHLDEAEAALVRNLFQGHVERSKSDVAEWQKSNRSSP